MNRLYETLKEHQQHVTHWCYGHFHQSWHSSIDGTLFKMLDIMEFYELKLSLITHLTLPTNREV
mgnify:CR=1 FL=1